VAGTEGLVRYCEAVAEYR